MLKLSTSYSKKVPVEGQDYSSQSYHAAVELELSDALEPREVQAKIHETFDMVKRAVESELQGRRESLSPDVRQPRNGGNAQPASNKQIKYLTDLAADQRISISELNAQVRTLYGVETIYDLTKRDASRLVDSLKSGNLKAA